MNRQEALLRKALRERGTDPETVSVRIDHPNGRSWIDGMEVGVIYPDSFFDRTGTLFGGPKTRRYYFRGVVGSKGRRRMLKPWMHSVEHNDFGRDPDKKDEYDPEYFERLASAVFGLCPHHPEWITKGLGPPETMWTYRFIDCVLVGAVPVLFRETPLGPGFINGFRYLWDDEEHVYSESDALHNRTLSKERFRLP